MYPLPVLTVSAALESFNELLKPLEVRIEGEIAGFSISRDRFVFFDLKDEAVEARVGCFMMKHQLAVPLEDGMKVVIHGRPGIFTKSGRFTITVSQAQPTGEGALKRAFELLKAKLEAEGLFAPARKRTLPAFPQTIGIVSSKTAAGLGDFMRIARERCPGVHYVLADAAVQGMEAERELIAGLDYLNSYSNPDVIVMIRGGGSLEDLHAFNSEAVARAIVRSKAPVVVGVGHERDVTIADYCADLRAPTPSAAAQLVVPDREEVLRQVGVQCERSGARLQREFAALRHRVRVLLLENDARIRHDLIHSRNRLDLAVSRSAGAVASYMDRLRYRVRLALQRSSQRIETQLHEVRQRGGTLLARIEAFNPQQVLERGYGIVRAEGAIVRSTEQIPPGSRIHLTVRHGTAYASVTETHDR